MAPSPTAGRSRRRQRDRARRGGGTTKAIVRTAACGRSTLGESDRAPRAERRDRLVAFAIAPRSCELAIPFAKSTCPVAALSRLPLGDRDSAARFAGRRFRASPITSCVGTDGTRRPPATSITGLSLGQRERSSHRCRHTRCPNSSGGAAHAAAPRAPASRECETVGQGCSTHAIRAARHRVPLLLVGVGGRRAGRVAGVLLPTERSSLSKRPAVSAATVAWPAGATLWLRARVACGRDARSSRLPKRRADTAVSR